MKSYLSLIPISAKVHRRQNRMTLLCIIFAVFLVTAIFSMMEMWTDSEVTSMRRKHGDWHIVVQNVSEDKGGQIRENPDIAYFSWYEEINADADEGYFINGKNAVLYGTEETYLADIRKYPLEGRYPESEKEAALSADAKELFGIQTGEQIILQTPAGNVEYTVSGFYEDDSEFNDIIGGCCVYMGQTAFDKIRDMNNVEPAPQFYVRFQKENGLKDRIADFKQQYDLTEENVEENTAVLLPLGASGSSSVNDLYPLAAVCFLIILFAGIFMISSCMNSNVAQRTAFFGMMRCIGASKQQIIRFVRLEALNWCKTAIPIGCLLGAVTCWILCAILRFFVKGEFADMPLFTVSIQGILWGVAVGIITVFLAAHSPAKQAAKVSPVAAVSGNIEMSQKIHRAANTRLFKVETSLGVKHAVESKKNLLLMTGSFALMIVLFLVFSACLDLVHKLLPSVSDFTPDIMISSQDEENSIELNLPKEISQIPGVDSAFGIMYHAAFPVEVNGQSSAIDLFSYDYVMMEQFKDSVISGNLEKVMKEEGFALAVYNQDVRLNVGDKVKIGEKELEIACVTSEGVGSISGSPIVVCSEETFTYVTGEQDYGMAGVVLNKEVSDQAVSRIKDLAGDNNFVDNREANSDNYGSYWVFRIAAYGFLAIISFITMLNIMNSISMSVSARLRQYGAMRAVGMSVGQVTRMIAAEAVTYAVCGTIAGYVFGLFFHHLFYRKIIITHFGGGWSVPLFPMAIILALVSVSCILAIYSPSKRMKNLSVTETINEL